jgi:hypothetical protein
MTPDEVNDLRRWFDASKGLADGNPFLGDRRLDAMLDVLLELAGQLWVVKRRNATLEAALTRAGSLDAHAVEDHAFTPEETAQMREQRGAFVATIFRSLAELPTEVDAKGMGQAAE